jgi:energy-coupling factor transporter ATP-binding protein EcfA2
LPASRSLESFDFAFQPTLSARVVQELATLSFVQTGANVVLLGPPGVGKTHLTLALAGLALVEGFGRIVRGRADTELESWLTAAARSRITELVSFARGLQRDLDAVVAALRSLYSQGQTEGHVNRLKLLKRQSYGRAGFNLFRRRVLYLAA